MTWPPGQPYPPPTGPQPPRRSRKGLIIGPSLLGAFAVLAIVTVVFSVRAPRDTAVVAELEVGDCVADLPAESRLVTLPTIDCAQAHDGEVYSVLTMNDQAFPTTMNRYQDECAAELARNGPFRWPALSVGLYVLHPTPETWAAGDRSFTCIARFDPKRPARPPGS